MGGLDLAKFFYSHEMSKKQCKKLIDRTDDEKEDPTIMLLALQGLHNIEDVVQKQQFNFDDNGLREFLRKWRNEATFSAYHMLCCHTVPLMKCLTIFKHYKVPLFVDDCGQRRLISEFEESDEDDEDSEDDDDSDGGDGSDGSDENTNGGIENIDDDDINEDTEIFHVTHSKEADLILGDGKLKSFDSKNIIPGVWFGMKDPQKYGSLYGSKSYKFTLRDFGITGLVQGEIITYKQECNVILYATDQENANFSCKRPTLEAVRDLLDTEDGFVQTSIFIPERFIVKYFSRFQCGLPQPVDVTHGPFCARELRSGGKYKCGHPFNEP